MISFPPYLSLYDTCVEPQPEPPNRAMPEPKRTCGGTGSLAAWLLAACVLAVPLPAADVRLLPEHLRTTPTGEILAHDRTAAVTRDLAGARASYLSFQIVVTARGAYTLDLEARPPGLELDVFREWYHRLHDGGALIPDALIPVALPYRSSLPEPDNRIESQTAQAFWIDVWIPKTTPAGKLNLTFRSGEARLSVPITVLNATTPDEDVVAIDHNSYGVNWLEEMYPSARGNPDRLFELIHAHHRIFYEHRGVFHQLGYGHAGKVGPEFAPALEGSGRGKRIANWTLYDRHYGPLFDGSALKGTRRGPRPIPFAYLPINPEWPASYLWWGEPGYEAEFVNVVREMDRHFRDKGWTNTRFELFFNHKKRYMGFSWDGDEARFAADNEYLKEYGRLLKKAVAADSPVKWVYRADVSWSIEPQSKDLAGIINFWVCAGDILSWYPEVARELKRRGDIVWFYSGPPPVTAASARITEFPLRAWLWGIDGYIHWLTVAPGRDPWFDFDGGGTTLVYPGERFGISAPIPSIRLKLQRNAIQDLALLASINASKAEVAKRFNGSRLEDWWNPRPPLADKPPQEWTGPEIDAASTRTRKLSDSTRPDAWQRVHEYAVELVSQERRR
jgi:hypothetical protein